jgi:hypothetical protein
VIDAPRNGKKARRVLREGVTCWRIARADRVGILIDGAAYYLALLRAFHQARSRIMILGWDFDPGIRLDPGDPATELRRLLSELVERRPDLNVHLLIWDVSLVFGPSRTLEQAFDDWQALPGSTFASTDSTRSSPPTMRRSSVSMMRSRSSAASISPSNGGIRRRTTRAIRGAWTRTMVGMTPYTICRWP